jgi:hypothetical protein
MRRCAAGQKAHFGKAQFVRHFLRQPQMPIVNGIKCTAEDANRSGHSAPVAMLRYEKPGIQKALMVSTHLYRTSRRISDNTVVR